MSVTPVINKFAELLQPALENGVKVLNYSSYHLIAPGENYGGVILAVDVHLQLGNGTKTILNLVAKLGPPNEMLCEMFNIQYTFKREMHAYMELIPALIQFQKDFKISENKILGLFPKCYAARLNLNQSDRLDDDGVMLFENLKTQHFTMENRMIGFDLDHSVMFLKNLARFHALPIALKELRPEEFQARIVGLKPASFGNSFTKEMKELFLVELEKIIKELDGCSLYADKIINLVDKQFRFEERYLEPTYPFATTVHHDLWANNIMVLKNAEGKPLEIKLYDLQMLSYGSLAHDLIFFLFSSVEQNVFNQHYNYLIKTYYDSFLECLNEFNLNTSFISWDLFQNELNYIGPYQISHIVIMMRPIFMEKGKVQDNAEMNGNDMTQLQFLNSGYKHKMRSIILAFAERNWL